MIRNKISIMVIFLLIFFQKNIAQQVYHVQRKNMHGIVPDGYQIHIDPQKLINKITVYNAYNRPYKVLFSYDEKNWDTLNIPNLQFAIFKPKKLFAKIITNSKLSYTMELEKSNVYQLRYDFSQKEWLIDLKQTIEK